MRWIWLIALSACGDNVTPRLTPLTYDLAGTTFTVPQHFHDRLRDEECSPVAWADAATYCTPAYRDAVYTNSGCSDPIAQGDAAYVATYFSLAGQTSLRRLRPVAQPIAAPAQYWRMVGAMCTGPFPPDPATTWHAVGDELDESAFVRLYRSAPEGSGRLQQIAWNSADGLHVPAGLHDRDLASDCELAPEHDRDTVACEPAGTFPADVFADAACTRRAILAGDQMPAFGRWDCTTYAPVTQELSGPTVYVQSSDGSCSPVTVLATRLFAVGTPVDVAQVTRERGAGERIQPIELVAGELRAPDAWVHDTQLDADCQPAEVSGELRCAPATTDVATYFSDDQCAQAIDVAVIDGSACTAPPHYAYRPDAFHRIDTPIAQPLYVPSTGDRCMLQPIAAPLEPHAVGGPLPVETFVPAL